MDEQAGDGAIDGTEETALEHARDEERMHRALQQQGGAGQDDRPPVQRERDEAIDGAMEDVRRAEREAADARRPQGLDGSSQAD